MLAEASEHFGVQALVAQRLGAQDRWEAETNAYIADRAKAALQTLKWCRTEQQRVEYHIALAVVAPRPCDSMLDRVAKRLGIRYGARDD
jgi:hypothetical protein